jgi:dTDP-4-dehydrorhamnose reductase
MTDFLVTGAGGALGSVLMRELGRAQRSASGIVSPAGAVPFEGQVFCADLADPRTFRERLIALTPKVIVHCAAVAQPADAYREGAPYDEDATPEPLSIYGRTKLEAECHVLTYRRGLVLRFPLLYGLPEAARKPTFFETLLGSLRDSQPVRLFTDEVRTPLWLDDAARACIALAQTDLRGVVHVGGPERLSRFEMGERIAAALGASCALIERTSRTTAGGPEPRARDVSLDSTRYLTHFGVAPGRPMHEALPLLLAQPPNRLLS